MKSLFDKCNTCNLKPCHILWTDIGTGITSFGVCPFETEIIDELKKSVFYDPDFSLLKG